MNKYSQLLKLANDLDKKGDVRLADKLEKFAVAHFPGRILNFGENSYNTINNLIPQDYDLGTARETLKQAWPAIGAGASAGGAKAMGLAAGSGTMTGVGALGPGLIGGGVLATPIVAGGAGAYWAGQELNKAYQQAINASEGDSEAGARYLTMLRQREQQATDPAQKQHYRQLYQQFINAQAAEYGVGKKV